MTTISNKILSLGGEVATLRGNTKSLLAALREGSIDVSDVSAQIESATRQAIESVLAELEGLQVMDISQNLDNQDFYYETKNEINPNTKYAVELFSSTYSMSETFEVSGVKTVAGDDSVDIDDTSDLVLGEDYVLQATGVQVEVTVGEILTSTRFKATSAVQQSMAGGTLTKTNWTIGDGQAVANNGEIYFSKSINVDPFNLSGEQVRSVIVRQTATSDPLTLYFRDEETTEWTEASWAWKRTTKRGFVTTQYVDDSMLDYEYLIPTSGDFEIKLVSNTDSTTIKFIVVLTQETNITGIHHSPNAPTIISPSDEETDVGEQAVFTVAETEHPVYGSSILKACFQITTTSGDYSDPVYDEICHDGISISLERDILVQSTVYYARAYVVDEEGAASEWSEEISFTTAAEFFFTDTPTCVSPSANDELLTTDGLTLVSSSFSYDGDEDTHAASQWQVASDALFETVLDDSGTDTTNLTSYDVPDDTVARGGLYYWRVRHQGTSGGWSGWSATIRFYVREFYPFVAHIGNKTDDYTVFYGCANDSEGNLIAVGQQNETAVYGKATVLKLDHEGNEVWQKEFGGTKNDMLACVAIDSDDYIYIAGYSQDTGGDERAIVMKMNSNGGIEWQITITDDELEAYPLSIKIDSSGDVLVAGWYRNADSGNDGFLIKLDPSDGSLTWQKIIGNGYYTRIEAIAIDSDDNSYAAGFDRVSGDINHAMVIKYDSTGSISWQMKMGGDSYNYFYAIDVDNNGSVYAAGHDQNDGEGGWEAMVFKLSDSDGSVTWKKIIGGTSQDQFSDIKCANDGYIYAVGNQASDTSYSLAGCIVKIASDGTLVYQKDICGTASGDYIYGISESPDETLYVVGYSSVDMGVSFAFIASFDYDMTDALGTIPDLTDFLWETSTLTYADSTMTLSAGAMTGSTDTKTASDTAFTMSNTNLTILIGSY